jgi:hypothetical protein
MQLLKLKGKYRESTLPVDARGLEQSVLVALAHADVDSVRLLEVREAYDQADTDHKRVNRLGPWIDGKAITPRQISEQIEARAPRHRYGSKAQPFAAERNYESAKAAVSFIRHNRYFEHNGGWIHTIRHLWGERLIDRGTLVLSNDRQVLFRAEGAEIDSTESILADAERFFTQREVVEIAPIGEKINGVWRLDPTYVPKSLAPKLRRMKTRVQWVG